MDCPQTDPLSTVEYLREFNRKAAQQRIPLSGSIELTHRCNLKCAHCYLGVAAAGGETGKAELSTAQVLSVLDQATEAGCLNLLITGGEPMLRQDFPAIYRHAKQNGLLVTVFTNGTLITDDILDLFSELPPRQVEISLYGATAATYEAVTGAPGSFERCLAGIQSLLDARLHVGLKTILMTLNRHEFFAIQQMAEDMGVRFRFDAAITPCLNGDPAPLQLRVSAEEAVAKEMADKERIKKWCDFFAKHGNVASTGILYQCGAGVTAFHIDPYGCLRPCLMVAEPSCDLATSSFASGWQTVIPRLHERKETATSVCTRCDKRALCGYCPAFFAKENGAEDVPSEYLCTMGRLRYEAITGQNSPSQGERASDGYEEHAAGKAILREAEAPRH